MNRKLIGSLAVLAGLAMACEPSTGDLSPDGTSLIGDSGLQSPGKACGSADLCIGVKYVVFKNSSGTPVANVETAKKNIQTSNKIWSSCGIGFRLESFEAVDPRDYGLSFGGAAAANETYSSRVAFQEKDTFLVVTTGAWGTTKNAWTESPTGSGKYGVIMEASVAGNGNILAHELGHYLGLSHSGTGTNVMSTIIYPNSTALSKSQCSIARDTAENFWPQMLR